MRSLPSSTPVLLHRSLSRLLASSSRGLGSGIVSAGLDGRVHEWDLRLLSDDPDTLNAPLRSFQLPPLPSSSSSPSSPAAVATPLWSLAFDGLNHLLAAGISLSLPPPALLVT